MNKLTIIFFLFLFVIFSGWAQKKFITYKVQEGETIESIAKKLQITPNDLLKLNPDISKNISPNTVLVIPNKDFKDTSSIQNIDLSFLSANDIIVDNYIYHEVLKKETLFNIKTKYKTSIEALNDANPILQQKGLKFGTVIKIPVPSDLKEITEKEKYTKPYLVKPKETKFSIAKNHGISIAYLEELNPHIKENGLQYDDVILVPSAKVNPIDSNFTIHTVKKMETFFSLSNQYGVSKEELIAANPELENGVKEGMLIKIPRVNTINESKFIDEIPLNTKLNIALMLPFKSKRDSIDMENDRLLNITTDYYFGSLMAIDSLKSQGLNIDLQVFDTENSAYVSDKISKRMSFENFDGIIGPLFFANVEKVSNNLKQSQTLIVSPISSQDHSRIMNRNLVQNVPTKELLGRKMLSYIKSIYSNQKLIVVADEESNLDAFDRELITELIKLDTINQVQIIRPEKGYIKRDLFVDNIAEEIDNWILLVGNKEVFVADVVNNLGVIPEEKKVTLFAFNKGRNLDKVDNYFLARVNFHYPSSIFLNEESVALKRFEEKYKKRFHVYPSLYAIEGFDMAYDLLMRLATGNNLSNQGSTKRIATKYQYIENASGSIINRGIFILKYDGLHIKEVDLSEY